MDITGRLQQIEELVQEAKSMPLSSSVLVNREEMLELLDAAREDLPEEIKQARWVVKDREELLAKARRDGDLIVEHAREEQARLVSDQEVVREAREEAERVLGEATDQARRMRLEAEDYVDARLAAFERALERTAVELDKSIGQVRRGRERLRAPMGEPEDFATGEPDLEEEGA